MQHPDSRAKAHHILIETEEACLALKDKITSFDDFCEQAKQHSICPSAKIGGSLGLTKPEVLVKEMEDAIFSVPMAAVAGPIQTVHGYHLIWVVKRNIAEGAPKEQPQEAPLDPAFFADL